MIVEKTSVVALAVLLSRLVLADPLSEADLMCTTNIWNDGQLERFVAQGAVDPVSAEQTWGADSVRAWFKWLVLAKIPTNGVGIAQWNSRTPACDWIRVRESIVRRYGVDAPYVFEDDECREAVEQGLNLAQKDKPPIPSSPFPIVNVDNGVTITRVPSLGDLGYRAYEKQVIYARDLNVAIDSYIKVLQGFLNASCKARTRSSQLERSSKRLR